MSLIVACHKCGKKLKVPDRSAGKRGKCPGCGAIVPVPKAIDPHAAPASAGGAPAHGDSARDPTDPLSDEMIAFTAAAEALSGGTPVLKTPLEKSRGSMSDLAAASGGLSSGVIAGLAALGLVVLGLAAYFAFFR